jgi:hypothetical protein
VERLKIIDEHEKRIQTLEKALSNAQDLAMERLDIIGEHEKRIQEYEKALSHAQTLAYERLDIIQQLETEVETLKNHPGYKTYEKIKGILKGPGH